MVPARLGVNQRTCQTGPRSRVSYMGGLNLIGVSPETFHKTLLMYLGIMNESSHDELFSI